MNREPTLNLRAETDRHHNRKQRCSSIPTCVKTSTDEEIETLRLRVAARRQWMQVRQLEKELEALWVAEAREETAREFFRPEPAGQPKLRAVKS